MTHYAISMADGSVSILQTVPQADGKEPTPQECIAKWHESARANVVSIAPLDPAVIPADRTFRDAWKLDKGGIVHDLGKAKEIQRARIRAARDPLFADLDTQQLRALAAGDGKAVQAIEAKKQALRDAPADPAIEKAGSVEELKALPALAV